MKEGIHVGNGIILNKKWEFNENVAKNFDIHIKKSIPFYEIGHELILDILEIFLESKQQKKIIITDLGCSTGSLIYKISKKFSSYDIEFYGIDKESSMIEIAKKREYAKNHKIRWITTNLENLETFKSDFIIAYYVLQFIKESEREKIIRKIYKNLKKTGVFFLFEKIKQFHKRMEQIHQKAIINFKLKQGYTLEEIHNKEKSLKGILLPLTIKDNFMLLEQAGFKNYTTILQYASFVGIVALK